MKTIRLYLYIIMCTLSAIAFTACDKDAHDDEYPLGDGQGAFIVGLVSEQPVSNLNVFLFGSKGSTVVRKDYADPRACLGIPPRGGGQLHPRGGGQCDGQ